jgi:hypothetical protein
MVYGKGYLPVKDFSFDESSKKPVLKSGTLIVVGIGQISRFRYDE